MFGIAHCILQPIAQHVKPGAVLVSRGCFRHLKPNGL
jgi:hypothetical protein